MSTVGNESNLEIPRENMFLTEGVEGVQIVVPTTYYNAVPHTSNVLKYTLGFKVVHRSEKETSTSKSLKSNELKEEVTTEEMDKTTAKITHLIDSDALVDITNRMLYEDLEKSQSPISSPQDEQRPSQNTSAEKVEEMTKDSLKASAPNNDKQELNTKEHLLLLMLTKKDLQALEQMLLLQEIENSFQCSL